MWGGSRLRELRLRTAGGGSVHGKGVLVINTASPHANVIASRPAANAKTADADRYAGTRIRQVEAERAD
jgi:hypothetical protein